MRNSIRLIVSGVCNLQESKCMTLLSVLVLALSLSIHLGNMTRHSPDFLYQVLQNVKMNAFFFTFPLDIFCLTSPTLHLDMPIQYGSYCFRLQRLRDISVSREAMFKTERPALQHRKILEMMEHGLCFIPLCSTDDTIKFQPYLFNIDQSWPGRSLRK